MAERNVHITAKCPYFEIYEIIPERKAVRRLEGIKESFHWYDKNPNTTMDNAKLKVTTGIHNPEFNFKWN